MSIFREKKKKKKKKKKGNTSKCLLNSLPRILSINYHKKTFISGDFDGMLLFSERKKKNK